MEKKMSIEKEIAVRPIDELGRVVLPTDIRHKLDLKANDNVSFFEKDGNFVIKKYKPSCTFCGSEEALITYNEKYICKKCNRSINSLIESEQ